MENKPQRITIRATKPSFTKEQKVAFGIITGTGCIALVLGGLYLVRHIAEPFYINYSGEMYLSAQDQQALEMAEQQKKDTDSDGLTDYDELYVYGSSPYLMDTDGDGYTDLTEVTNGTNPACAGENCAQDTTSQPVGLFDDLLPSTDQVADIAPSMSIEEIQQAVKSLTIDEIRDLLIQAGADSEELANISDEELQALFTQVMSDLESSGDFDQYLSQQ